MRTKESAEAVAKRFDHSELTAEHVLLGALGLTSAEELKNRDKLIEAVEISLRRRTTNRSGASLTSTEEAQTWLQKLESSSGEGRRDALQQLTMQVLGENALLDTPVISAPETPANQATTSSLEEESNRNSDSSPDFQDPLEELDSLIGLLEAKKAIHGIVASHKANQIRSKAGKALVPLSLHLVFQGPPGTGKTTVARLISRIYQQLELLPSGHLVEVGRADLVAGYVGQTAMKVEEVFRRAKGGVLFIDEAYSLADDVGSGFGGEAISALVQHMENERRTTAVIVAGYPEPIKDLLSSNSGLRSRFQQFINFQDYTTVELFHIFQKYCQAHHIELPIATAESVRKHLAQVPKGGHFGNARYVRSLFEQMAVRMAERANHDGEIHIDELHEFTESDVPERPLSATALQQRAGFTAV